MRKLFGTDGVRGKANIYPITPELALLVGKATAAQLGGCQDDRHRRIILGKDTTTFNPARDSFFIELLANSM